MTASPWTRDRVERLKSLWRDGQSAETVAADLGAGLTRSAVLGKVFRLGLSAGRPERGRAARTAALRDRARALADPGGGRTGPAPHAAPRAATAAAPVRPDDGPDIVSVGAGQCRWPYGDPGSDLVLCGRRVARGAYCAGHAALAYRAPPGGVAGLLALAALN